MNLNEVYQKHKNNLDRILKSDYLYEPTNEIGNLKVIEFLFNNNKKIHKLQSTINKKSIDELIQEDNFIFESEHSAKNYLKENINLTGYELLCAKVEDIVKKYKTQIFKNISKLSQEFETQYNVLKSSETLTNIKSQRKKVDQICNLYLNLHEIAKKRNITFKAYQQIIDYHHLKKKHNNLKQKIESIIESYQNIENLKNSKKMLKKISKSLKGNFSNIGLIVYCKDLDYFEGVYKINTLSEEIKFVLKTPNYFEKEKKEINKSLKQIKESNNKINHNDLKSLSEYDINKFLSVSIYNKNIEQNYKKNAFKVNARIRDAKKQEEIKNKKYTSQNSIKDQIDKFEIKIKEPKLKIEYGNNYLFADQIRKITMPRDPSYRKIRDILTMSVEANGWIDRMQMLEDEARRISNVSDLQKTNYLMNVYKEMQNFYNQGHLGELAKYTAFNKTKINNAMNTLFQVAKKVA